MSGPPPTLKYAGPGPAKPSRAAFVCGSVILAVAFLVAANVVEGRISDHLATHDGQLGLLALDAQTLEHVQRHGDTDGIVELIWSIPASVAFLTAVSLSPPRRRWQLGWAAWLTTLSGAAVYSGARWFPNLIHAELGEGVDFLLAMLLAVAAGSATAVARRRQH